MRLKYIDSAKGFAMLLILWGHIVNFSDGIALWGSGFKITLFYIVTGYLISLRADDVKKTPVKKLVFTSGVPYVFYSVLSLLFAFALGFAQGQPAEFFGEKIIRTLTLSGVSTLWFLPSAFFGRFLFERLFSCKKFALGKAVLLILLPFALCFAAENAVLLSGKDRFNVVFLVCGVIIKAVTAFWFISVGFVLSRLIRKSAEKPNLLISVGMLFSGSVIAFFNKGVDMNNVKFGSVPLLFFVTGVLCSFGITGIFSSVTKKTNCRLTQFVGENSLFIMVTHLPLYIVPVVTLALSKMIAGEGTAFNYLRAVISLLLVLLIEWILIRFKNRLVALLDCKLKNKRIKQLIKYI